MNIVPLDSRGAALQSRVVTDVGHELSTLLNLIIGFSEVMILSLESHGGQTLPGGHAAFRLNAHRQPPGMCVGIQYKASSPPAGCTECWAATHGNSVGLLPVESRADAVPVSVILSLDAPPHRPSASA
ncbi:MAG: hypothetical protein IAE81_11360 [Caldilineaceae bacterium]|jgi:hypothetical protein|nr:hypothetical protein [Caldilineaceae bacterium]